LHLPRGRIDFFQSTTSVLLLTCFLALATRTSIAAVTATRLDGATISGELRSWTESQLVIATSAGEQHITAEELLSLSWPAADKSADSQENASGLVDLTDGSEIPIENISVRSKQSTSKDQSGSATLTSPRSTSPKSPVVTTLPTNRIAVVLFKPVNGALVKQWAEIRGLKSAGDLLVVAKRDGTSLDYVEGVVGEVSSDKVEFKLDGETNRVDRARVTGIVYSHPSDPSAAKTNLVVHGRSGLRLNVNEIHLADDFVTMKTTGGTSVRWPVSDLDGADFSSGKLMYLSDIEPASQNWTPLVGLPTGISLAAQYGLPRRNHSAFGDMLTLNIKNKNDDTTRPGALRSFTKGLALRSRTELVYRLPEGFNRFTALAGIDPDTASTGNVQLTILADDRSLLATEVAGGQSPLPIDVAISNAKRLKIIVDFGQNLDTGDWLNLCDAKILK
jgi:hypothetical protein